MEIILMTSGSFVLFLNNFALLLSEGHIYQFFTQKILQDFN